LDDESREAFWKGQRVDLLSPKSFSILRLLSNAPDKAHSLSAVKKAANIREEAEDAFVYEQIALIKRAFTDVDPNGAPIAVIFKQGYQWNEPAPKLKERLAAFFRRSPET
jgi:DNA-binding response OmpR family regulator